MPIVSGDIKLYESDVNGNIDINSEITASTVLFPDVLDIEIDVETKIWIKNTHASESLLSTKFYNVNGFTVTNTNNTPVKAADTECYINITPGTYTLTFPTSSSVVVTPPSGIPRAAQDIVVDGSTLNAVYLLDNMPIYLAFDTSLSTQDTATIEISDGASYIQIADDNAGVPGTYSLKNSYADGVNIGTLASGGTHAVWLKQVIPDGTSAGDKKQVLIARGQDD